MRERERDRERGRVSATAANDVVKWLPLYDFRPPTPYSSAPAPAPTHQFVLNVAQAKNLLSYFCLIARSMPTEFVMRPP